MEGLEDVKKELEAKRMQLEHELDEAKGKLSAIEADLRRVDDALGALTKKKGKSRSSPKKPSLTVDSVRQNIADARLQAPFAAGRELEDLVRSLAQKSGGSMGEFEKLYVQALAGTSGPFDPM
jgi:predicted  nucleic acid-binding Zn-ribbon protein